MLARGRSDISLTRLQGNPSAVAGMDVTITSRLTKHFLFIYRRDSLLVGPRVSGWHFTNADPLGHPPFI